MKRKKLSTQIKEHAEFDREDEEIKEFDGNEIFISTGSTLLDLAITGGRTKWGGIPTGILVEIFGPNGAGKTVLLTEMAGAIQREGGSVLFLDPEARFDKAFGDVFGFDLDTAEYQRPDTVSEVFNIIEKWEPKNPKLSIICADSLAALSTRMEIDNEDGDKMGMRRAKEFSEGCRKVCRYIANKNMLLVCSNQIRQNLDAGPYGEKYKSPGGEAIPFYSSLRLRMSKGIKKKDKKKFKGKEVSRISGIETTVYVYKSSVWKPYREAPINIVFDYGIDDVGANLQFLKKTTGSGIYKAGDIELKKSLADSIAIVEKENLEKKVKIATMKLWREIEETFKSERKPKVR